MDRFLTAQEIADAGKRLKLTCVPHSKRGVNKRAGSEGWDGNPPLARRRTGTAGGGGMEYHISLLPEPMQAALAAEVSKEVAVSNSAERREVEVAKREALNTTALTARQRQVMTSRSTVLTAIENVQIAEGLSRNQAVGRFCQPDQNFGLDHETIVAANDRANGNAKISRRTLLRWFQFRDGSGIGALAPKPTKELAEIPQWFWAFMRHYARPQKPCITEALDAFLRGDHGINEEVTYPKVRRLLNKLGNVEKHRGREGSLTLKARMAYVTRSTGDLLPTCVYTSDGKTFDAEIAHPIHGRPFRPEVTSVVDVATRKCVGFSIGLAENAEGVVDGLRYSCERHGIPAIFYVDRGSGFKNNRLDDRLSGLMGRLGITKYHSLPQNSQARGIIERFHGSVWNPLSREYDTYVGVDMDRQARQKSFKVTRKQIKEVGVSAALPSWDEFLDGCNRAIAAYNAKPHAALPGRQSPDEYWQWHVDNGFEPVTVTTSESADLFRPYVKRKTRRALIEFKTNKYFNIDLEEFDGDYVLVGYDIHDASQIWVREIDQIGGEECGGRLICIAKFAGNEERYVPVSMERLALENRAKARAKRLSDKMEEVEAELKPHRVLEAQAEMPIPPLNASGCEPAIEGEFTRIEDSPIEEASTLATPRFGSDAELAQWALENPDNLKTSQLELLRACLSDTADRQLLQDHGVDVEKLITIVRQAA